MAVKVWENTSFKLSDLRRTKNLVACSLHCASPAFKLYILPRKCQTIHQRSQEQYQMLEKVLCCESYTYPGPQLQILVYVYIYKEMKSFTNVPL